MNSPDMLLHRDGHNGNRHGERQPLGNPGSVHGDAVRTKLAVAIFKGEETVDGRDSLQSLEDETHDSTHSVGRNWNEPCPAHSGVRGQGRTWVTQTEVAFECHVFRAPSTRQSGQESEIRWSVITSHAPCF